MKLSQKLFKSRSTVKCVYIIIIIHVRCKAYIAPCTEVMYSCYTSCFRIQIQFCKFVRSYWAPWRVFQSSHSVKLSEIEVATVQTVPTQLTVCLVFMIVVTFLMVKDDFILSILANPPSAILWLSQPLRISNLSQYSKTWKKLGILGTGRTVGFHGDCL